MKKIIVLLLTFTLVLGIAACGNNANNDADNNANNEANNEVEVMTYAEYAAAELETEVVIEAYVQATQSWWENKINVYAQDRDGAYFIYEMACTEEDAAKLTPGTKIRVTGNKMEWAGEVEIGQATFEFVEGGDTFEAEAKDMTDLLANEDELIKSQNIFASFTGMTIEESEGGVAFLYNWDGSGEEGSDLYFNASINGETYTFVVEAYLCGPGTDVYEAVKALHVGDVVDMEGFLYWYEGVQPHITKVTVK